MRINKIKLSNEMARRDLTVKMLSELAWISRLTASNIKRGASCSSETAVKIAKVFNTSLESLTEQEE